jgi:FtsP/CotA-like multicopper oxidase with cupredoxin domain
MAVYGVYSVNGRTGSAIEPLRVQPGALVRLRLVNAGFLPHLLHLHGAGVRIVATDGHDLVGGAETMAPLPLAAAERLDIEFTAPAGIWSLHAHDGTAPAAGLRVPILAPDAPRPEALPDTEWEANQAPVDLATYHSSSILDVRPAPSGKYFVLRLNETMAADGGGHGDMSGMGGMSGMAGMGDTAIGGLAFTINGKTFPDTADLQVSRGDIVTLTFVNEGKFVHPIHLHGHAFTPLSINGRSWASTMLKDTVSVPPSSTVVVRFTADNPGVWMIHCHELHHAAGGMGTLLVYQGAPRLATLSGPGQPAPE